MHSIVTGHLQQNIFLFGQMKFGTCWKSNLWIFCQLIFLISLDLHKFKSLCKSEIKIQ